MADSRASHVRGSIGQENGNYVGNSDEIPAASRCRHTTPDGALHRDGNVSVSAADDDDQGASRERNQSARSRGSVRMPVRHLCTAA